MEHIILRRLGRSGIEVSALGFGCWAIGGPAYRGETPVGWGAVDDAESLHAIRRALDLGITFFDTADVYGAGHSEHILGQALAGKRQQVVIATKFSNTFNEGDRQLLGNDASPGYIRRACEASLRRLGTDFIDLYQFHNGGYPLEQAGEVRETLEDLVRQGKIRWYGWSTDDPERARFFADGEHCAAVQNQMNVLDDAPEMVALCEAAGLASVNRGPLAMGLLTGKYSAGSVLGEDDVRGTRSPDWMKYFKDGRPNPEFTTRLEAIRGLLTAGGRTLAQGALAWLWGRSPVTIPIPGIRTVRQAEENARAMAFGPLSAEGMEEIGRILQRSR
jgi:aryl-alcohol dehydrogenase-like predicted oxidoreductase